jgi:hypothetical protein
MREAARARAGDAQLVHGDWPVSLTSGINWHFPLFTTVAWPTAPQKNGPKTDLFSAVSSY